MTAVADLPDLEQRVLANERLLSTLIALLSAREPRLLEELRSIFADPDFASDAAGQAASATWNRIADDLRHTGGLIESLGKSVTG